MNIIHRLCVTVIAGLLVGCGISGPSACSAETPPEDDEDPGEKCQNFNVTAVDQPSAYLDCDEQDTAGEWAKQLEIFRVDREATRKLAEQASDSDEAHRRITPTMRQYMAHQDLESLRRSSESLASEDQRIVYRYIAQNEAPLQSENSGDAGLGGYASPERNEPGDGIWIAIVVDAQSRISLDSATSAELMISETLDKPRIKIGVSDGTAEQIEALSRESVDEQIAFVYDDLVVSAPQIHEPLTNLSSVQVTPPFGPTKYQRKLPQKASD